MKTTIDTLKARHWWAAASLGAVAAAGVLVFGPQHGAQASAPVAAPPATPVSVATVAEREVTAWDEFSGRLEAVERVDIRSRVAGA
ncbi:MAG TPA: efflux transporter periplasmic adaptor subunit, partial [Ramlibacter sp.]